jgi:hypothetical protein
MLDGSGVLRDLARASISLLDAGIVEEFPSHNVIDGPRHRAAMIALPTSLVVAEPPRSGVLMP